jgi:predicted permease
MTWWCRLWYREKMEEELEKELRFHLEQHAADLIAQGLNPEEARRRARLALGSPEQVKEQCRDARGTRWLEDLLQDLRYGMRMLLKNPGFTTIAVLTLALGIGANTAIFTLANSLMFRPPAVKQPNQLVTPNGGRSNNGMFSYRDFQDYQQRNQAFEGMTAFTTDPVNVGLGQQNEMAAAEYVSSNFFTALGVNAARGHVFTAEDGQATDIPPVAVISASLWRRLGADADIMGKTIAVNQGRYTVIGVAAEGFKGVTGVLQADVWIMLEQAGQHIDGFAQRLADREVRSYQILARLKSGVSLQQAQAELQTIDQALDREFPRTAQTGADQQRLRPLLLERVAGAAAPGLKQQVAPVALLLLAVVGIILLLACANVANLLLARASARRREIAVRLSLGASRFRLLRQLMTESALLAALGAIAGMLFSIWVTRLMTASLPSFAGLRISIEPAVDGRVFGFTVAVATLSALLFGLVPAFQSTKPDPAATLKTGAETASSSNPFHRKFSLRNILVVAQFSLSLLLLLAAGLFVRSLQNASHINPGFKLESRMAMWVNPTPQKQTPAYTAEFYQHALERVRALPGVQTVGLIDYLPISLAAPQRCYAAAGQATMDARQQPRGGYSVIAPDYFAAIGIPLRHGRDFSLNDTPQKPGVVIVNETLARRLWPNADPLGQQLRAGEGCSQTLTVVGIAADSQYTNLGEAPQPHWYIPFTQQPAPWGWR